MPTEDKKEVKSIFYKNIYTICDLIPTDKVKILLGDFNVKIGQEIIYKSTIVKESLQMITIYK